jgi:hypothetical protein
MKQLLLHALTCCAILLPVQQASAQKKYGDLTPNTKFKMVVTKVTATVNTGSGNKPTQVPSGMPKFKVKDKIAFTIGNRGQLIGKLKNQSFNLPFLISTPAANTYVFNQVGTTTKTYTASLAKSLDKKPKSLVLDLNRTVVKIGSVGGIPGFPGIPGGVSTTTHKVIYELKLTK